MYWCNCFSQILAIVALLSFPIFRFDRAAKKFPWKQWLISMSILVLVVILVNKLF